MKRPRFQFLATLLAVMGTLIGASGVFAALPNDATAAWAEVEKAQTALRPPGSWQRQAPRPGEIVGFQKLVKGTALSYAGKAREFIQKFPTDENVGDARIALVHILNHAVAAGDTASEQEITKLVEATVADTKIPERDRVGVFLMAGNTPVFKEAGMRYFSEGPEKLAEEFDASDRKQMQEAMKLFPKSDFVGRFAIGIAARLEGDERKAMLKEIAGSKNSSDQIKKLAEHLLNGTKPITLGKPVEMKFTALDGTEMDMAKLKGSVVIIHFWSMQSPESLEDIVDIKDAYTKLHDRGLEVIGVNMDGKKAALWQFLKSKQVAWPQHFDGKGWANEYALKYGVLDIPVIWLVDKNGNLRMSNVRGNLDKVVQLFMGMKATAESEK